MLEESCNCYCCGDDLSNGEKKKRRRPLSSPDLQGALQLLISLISEQQGAIDVSKLHSGYVCRKCVGLLQRYASLHQQISDSIKAAIPILPSVDAEDCQAAEVPSTSAAIRTPRFRHVAAAATAATNVSPPVVVSCWFCG